MSLPEWCATCSAKDVCGRMTAGKARSQIPTIGQSSGSRGPPYASKIPKALLLESLTENGSSSPNWKNAKSTKLILDQLERLK